MSYGRLHPKPHLYLMDYINKDIEKYGDSDMMLKRLKYYKSLQKHPERLMKLVGDRILCKIKKRSFQIFVRSLSGRTLALTVSTHDTVWELCKKIGKKEKFTNMSNIVKYLRITGGLTQFDLPYYIGMYSFFKKECNVFATSRLFGGKPIKIKNEPTNKCLNCGYIKEEYERFPVSNCGHNVLCTTCHYVNDCKCHYKCNVDREDIEYED